MTGRDDQWHRRAITVLVVALTACSIGLAVQWHKVDAHPQNTPPGTSPGPLRGTGVDPVGVSVPDTLRALDKLRSIGYAWTSDAGALKAVKHWQRVNGLEVDGIVGKQTLASLRLTSTTTVVATVPATRVTPPAPAPPPEPVGDIAAIIRDVWPDHLEDRAVAIAHRESRLQPGVINRSNGDATGLFQIMWSVHRGWLCPQLGVCAQSDLQDARTNATAALALYHRAGSWQPWSLG